MASHLFVVLVTCLMALIKVAKKWGCLKYWGGFFALFSMGNPDYYSKSVTFYTNT
jgi:hypothetical protein